jgi:hypothetical protein
MVTPSPLSAFGIQFVLKKFITPRHNMSMKNQENFSSFTGRRENHPDLHHVVGGESEQETLRKRIKKMRRIASFALSRASSLLVPGGDHKTKVISYKGLKKCGLLALLQSISRKLESWSET